MRKLRIKEVMLFLRPCILFEKWDWNQHFMAWILLLVSNSNSNSNYNDNYRTFGMQNVKVKSEEERPKKQPLKMFLYSPISTLTFQFPFSLICYPHSTKTSLDFIIHHFNNLLPNTLNFFAFLIFITTTC